jgi:hypothetical protein
MTYVLSSVDSLYVAYFSRKEIGALGGDLEIFMERSGKLVCVIGGL